MSGRSKSEKRQRTRQVAVRFTPAEYEAAAGKAVSFGTTLPELVRHLIEGSPLRVSAPVLRDTKGGATGIAVPAAPNRTPLGKQEAG